MAWLFECWLLIQRNSLHEELVGWISLVFVFLSQLWQSSKFASTLQMALRTSANWLVSDVAELEFSPPPVAVGSATYPEPRAPGNWRDAGKWCRENMEFHLALVVAVAQEWLFAAQHPLKSSQTAGTNKCIYNRAPYVLLLLPVGAGFPSNFASLKPQKVYLLKDQCSWYKVLPEPPRISSGCPYMWW